MALDQTVKTNGYEKPFKSTQHLFKLEVNRLSPHLRDLYEDMIEYKKAYEQARREFEDALYTR